MRGDEEVGRLAGEGSELVGRGGRARGMSTAGGRRREGERGVERLVHKDPQTAAIHHERSQRSSCCAD